MKVALFGNEPVNFFATDGTVRLTNGLGSIAGSVVADGGELVLAASGVLGNLDDDRAVPELLFARSGSITVGGAESGAAVEQSIHALEVAGEGELRLADGSILRIAGGGIERTVTDRIVSTDDSRIELDSARLHWDTSAETFALENTLWKLDDASPLVVEYGVDPSDGPHEALLTSGTLEKTGSGRSDFESGVFTAGTTTLTVRAGETSNTDWDRTKSADATDEANAQALRLSGLLIANRHEREPSGAGRPPEAKLGRKGCPQEHENVEARARA